MGGSDFQSNNIEMHPSHILFILFEIAWVEMYFNLG